MDFGVPLIVRSSAQYLYNFFWTDQSLDWVDIVFYLSHRSATRLERLLPLRFDKDKLYNILQHQGRSKETAFHKAAMLDHVEHMGVLFDFLDTRGDKVYNIVRIQDITGRTCFHYMPTAHGRAVHILKVVQSKLSAEHWQQLMQIQDNAGRTWLHTAVGTLQVNTVKHILQSLEPESRWLLLNILDKKGENPLDKSVSVDFGHVLLQNYSDFESILGVVFDMIEDSNRRLILVKSLLCNLTKPEYLNFHKIYYSGNGGSSLIVSQYIWLIRAMLANLTPGQQLSLIGESSDIDSCLQQLSTDREVNLTGLIDFVQTYRLNLLVAEAVSSEMNELDREALVQNLTRKHPLSREQVVQLSRTSSYYVVPYNSSRSRHFGLILCNISDREGADEEANNIKLALESIGCEVIKIEWSAAHELGAKMDSILDSGILRNCSLLTVCIMTHGYRGVFSGSHGTEVPVNDVLNQLSVSLPEYLPLIMVVQACQGLVTQSTNASVSGVSPSDAAPTSETTDKHYNKHIVLRRPHTILLLATVMGGVAYRGLFTGALADELRKSDGNTDIYLMFTRATDKSRPYQTPEVRSTLQKTLILPPATSSLGSST